MLEEGQYYTCKEDVKMDLTGEVRFIANTNYLAVSGTELVNEKGKPHTVVVGEGEFFKKHFDPDPIIKYVKNQKRNPEKIIKEISETGMFMKEASYTSSITEEALNLIGGDRQESYGDVRTSFDYIAKVWSGILKTDVTGEQVALMMVGLKLVRQSNKHKRDNLVDLIGYAVILARLEGEE